MNLKPRLFVPVGIACLAAVSTLAQQVQHTPKPAPQANTNIFDSAGLFVLDGELVGNGPDYSVHIASGGGVEFTPAIPTSDHLHPLTLRVSGYGRGNPDLRPQQTRLTHQGATARYDHGGFVETLEMRTDGMKQNFIFARLPDGSGDLVVRVQVTTDLTPSVHAGGLQYLTATGEAGVSIGSVVGIDAGGNRTQGSMSHDNGTLEFRLPASFVQTAALPIVLDPLVGTELPVGGPSDDRELDIAYDATGNIYCAVWRRKFASTSYSLRARRLAEDGTTIGAAWTVQNLGGLTNPRIANIATERTFLVVYELLGDIIGRAVRVTDTSIGMSLGLAIRDTADTLAEPDVGGEAVFDNEGIVVWRNISANRIEARQVNVDGDVTPPTIAASASVVTIGGSSAFWANALPRISASGGSTGNHCIVWSRQLTSSLNTTVCAVIVNRNVLFVENLLLVTDPADGDCDAPTVDGNGLNWVISWERETTPGSLDNDIQARAVAINLNAAAPNQGHYGSAIVDIESQVNDDERGAEVAWMGDSALILYEDESFTPGDYDVFAQPVDLFNCQACAPRSFVDSAGGDQGSIRAASKATGGSVEDDALLVWSEFVPAINESRGYTYRFRAEDGINTNLGGGCGTAGEIFADCAIAGYGGFSARLRGSVPAANSWCVISPTQIEVNCGGCTLLPNPWHGWVVPVTVNFRGDATLTLGLPGDSALIGVQFLHQWIISNPASPACYLFDSDMSDALRTTIQ